MLIYLLNSWPYFNWCLAVLIPQILGQESISIFVYCAFDVTPYLYTAWLKKMISSRMAVLNIAFCALRNWKCYTLDITTWELETHRECHIGKVWTKHDLCTSWTSPHQSLTFWVQLWGQNELWEGNCLPNLSTKTGKKKPRKRVE